MKPALTALLALPLFAQQTVLLRPDAKPDPSAGPEKVEERGTGGVIDRSISNVTQPSLTVYLPPKSKSTGVAILIAPGGGYGHLAIDKEGHDIARWLNTIGVVGIVLKYRLPGGRNMRASLADMHSAEAAAHVAIEDAELAMHLVRKHAAAWNVKPNAVGMMGFSAGGHLAAMMGVIAPPDARPDFLALLYPAIPRGLEATSSTPRAFIAQADDDRLAPQEHSVRFYLALKQAKVPAELLVFSSGGHGFGIRKSGKTAAAWPDAFAAWLAEQRLGR
jgi:acetyl esterase/lipase